MRLARILITVVAALLATTIVMLGPVAGAAESKVDYPGGCAIVLSQVTATVGAKLTVTGTGFPPGSTVTFTLDAAPVLGTVTADATGTATLVFTLPANTAPGMHVITATGVPPGQCDPSVSTNLMVSASTQTTPPTTATSSGTLPRTGTDSALLMQIAVLLIAVGGLVTLTARKRMRHAHRS
jgi:LPXTG-motif cell wall-anchored protein